MTEMPGTRPKNPYRPGAAVTPAFLAGRNGEIQRFTRTLRNAPETPANIRIVGLRGVGKSVLLKEEESVALDWHTSRLQLEPRNNQEEGITELLVAAATQAIAAISRAARLRATIKGAAAAASRVLKVSFHDVEISLDLSSGSRQRDLAKALFDAAEAAYQGGLEGS